MRRPPGWLAGAQDCDQPSYKEVAELQERSRVASRAPFDCGRSDVRQPDLECSSRPRPAVTLAMLDPTDGAVWFTRSGRWRTSP